MIDREGGEALYRALIEDMEQEFPSFAVIDKADSRFQRVIDRALRIVTLGQMSEYLTHYQTTMGYRVYVTPDWHQRDPRIRYSTMRHERIHMRQFRRFTLVGMAALYLLFPLPMGAAWCRARFEWEAYCESMLADAEIYGLAKIRDAGYRQRILDQFLGPSYGWMWPFRKQLQRWYDRALAEVEKKLAPAPGGGGQ